MIYSKFHGFGIWKGSWKSRRRRTPLPGHRGGVMTQFRFGKHPPKNDFRTLRFKKYLKSSIAAPPSAEDKLAQVYKNLKMKTQNPAQLFPMDGNDTMETAPSLPWHTRKPCSAGLLESR